MARVGLTYLQCMTGQLPARCVVCGSEEEVEYLDREMEYRPTWPITFLGFHFVGWHAIGAVLGFFSERYNRELFTKFPYSEDHYDYWEKRDRRQHLGILILALGWLLTFLATFIQNNNVRLSSKGIAIVTLATIVGLIVIYSYGFKIIQIVSVENTRVVVANVHPDFVAAVEQRRDRDAR